MRLFHRRVKKVIAGVKVGRPHVQPDDPSHVTGVREGNARGHTKHERGIHAKKDRAWATATRSTGVNPLGRNSIVPGAPRLTPP